MKEYNKEKAIISLTSWKKRINTVHITIENILEIMPGFHVVLVLSEQEFPKKEEELPESLMSYVNGNKIELLWVYKNYKSFKKFIFTAIKYPKLPIIALDDGQVYLKNVAEILYKRWLKYKHTIISVSKFVKKSGISHGAGNRGILYPPSKFNRYVGYLDDERVIAAEADDVFWGCLAKKSNSFWRSIDPVGVRKNNFKVIEEAEEYGMTRNKVYNDPKAIKIFKKILKLR